MLKREIICVVVLVSSLVSACTDGNCLTCLPHDQNFCITCASTHRVKDGLCVADCDPDNTGYTEFLDSNGNKRCLNTFAIGTPQLILSLYVALLIVHSGRSYHLFKLHSWQVLRRQ